MNLKDKSITIEITKITQEARQVDDCHQGCLFNSNFGLMPLRKKQSLPMPSRVDFIRV